jgi:hypothetical protein
MLGLIDAADRTRFADCPPGGPPDPPPGG